MNFGLVIIGDEILSGKRADQHLAKSIALLGARGLQVAWADYVGDAPGRITDTLRRAFASGDVVFSFGGIGATPDDHTRQCAAAALGVELALHPQAEALIRERMRDMALKQGVAYEQDHPDNIHRLNMGMFPAGCEIIPNPYNKMPGFRCRSAGNRGVDEHGMVEPGGPAVHFVPGFPVMAWPMLEWVLDTHYSDLFVQGAWQEKSVIVFGAIEASLTPLMQQLEQAHPVKVFSLPSVDHPQYGRHVELGVKGHPDQVQGAYAAMMGALQAMQAELGPELVRP